MSLPQTREHVVFVEREAEGASKLTVPAERTKAHFSLLSATMEASKKHKKDKEKHKEKEKEKGKKRRMDEKEARPAKRFKHAPGEQERSGEELTVNVSIATTAFVPDTAPLLGASVALNTLTSPCLCRPIFAP